MYECKYVNVKQTQFFLKIETSILHRDGFQIVNIVEWEQVSIKPKYY